MPAGVWQAAEPEGDAVLCGCTVAPGFEFEDFEIGRGGRARGRVSGRGRAHPAAGTMRRRAAALLAAAVGRWPSALSARAAPAAASPPLSIETTPSPPARGSVVWLVVSPAGEPDTLAHAGRHRRRRAAPLRAPAQRPVPEPRRRSARRRRFAAGHAPASRTGGTADTVVTTLTVTHPVYASERLTVAPRYAEPDSASRARIDAELAQSRAISRQAHDTPRLWSGPFLRPRPSRITSVYGTGREFNGRVTSRHLGTDFAGAVGAPVRAAGRAVVALVADFYLAGHAVYLDHGGGLVTGYFHLSRVDVTAGDTVAAGTVIGAVGRSGRATGPHLHWIARYGGITVDPMSLFALPRIEPGDSGRSAGGGSTSP